MLAFGRIQLSFAIIAFALAPSKTFAQKNSACLLALVKNFIQNDSNQARRDAFLAALSSHPKFDIGNYVASHHFPVPKIYPDLASALKSGKSFIIRSEHPQDYFGASGIMNSFVVKDGKSDTYKYVTDLISRFQSGDITQSEFEASLKKHALGTTPSHESLKLWSLLGIPAEAYLAEAGYSYWEALDGYNRAVVADSAVAGRYHIFTTWTEFDGNESIPDPRLADSERFLTNYTIYENGKTGRSGPYVKSLPAIMENELPVLIRLYEQIRALKKFDANQVPLMEFQTVGGKNYFLQYLRTRSYSPATFSLAEAPEAGLIEADYVRGVTPAEGIEVEITYQFFGRQQVQMNPHEQGSVTKLAHQGYALHFVEARASRLKLAITDEFNKIAHNSQELSHLGRSTLFKPEISLGLSKSKFAELIPDDAMEKLQALVMDSDHAPTVTVKVWSDGRKAYIKFVSGPR